MSRIATKTVVTFFASLLLAAPLSFAQFYQPPPQPAPDAEPSQLLAIRKITQKLMNPPDFGRAATGMGMAASTRGQKWLLIETEFASRPEWADDVMLKYFVLVGRGEEARVLGGQVTHVNVARGTRNYSAMFMHPNTVQRFGRGTVEAVRVELWYRGQRMDEANDPPTRVRWWEGRQPVEGFLLNPQQTPWSIVAHERYEALKPTP
jgi:hypothetical protein